MKEFARDANAEFGLDIRRDILRDANGRAYGGGRAAGVANVDTGRCWSYGNGLFRYVPDVPDCAGKGCGTCRGRGMGYRGRGMGQ